MEKRNPTDESSAVKAAAWAWYQHGSGSEGRPASEYATTRTFRAHGPSRYKLEAVRTAEEAKMALESAPQSNSPLLLRPSNAGDSSDLFDAYEIKRISRQLDLYIDSRSGATYYAAGGDHPGGRRVLSAPESETTVNRMLNKKKEKRNTKGFGLIKHGVVCGGSRDEVVEPRGFSGGGWRPEKHVAVVGAINCRRRAAHA